MSKSIKDLINKERATINVIGILVILGLGIAVGVLFTLGLVPWGIAALTGGGFIGMVLAWINKPEA